MIRAFFLLCISILITACSSNSTKIIPPPESVDAIQEWQTSGRVGIRTDQDAISGNFNWQHSPEGFSLIISGPFGQGTTKISQDESQLVTLEYKDIKAVGPDAEALLEQHFGWQFPVNQIAYWARGLAEPNSAAAFTYNVDSQLLEALSQDGWLVKYKEFTNVRGLELPRKLQAVKAPFRVNLIMNDWTIQ